MLAGARVALGVGFMVIVGAEMIGTTRGLGALIMEARTFYRSDITVVGMFVIGAIGLALSLALTRAEAWLLPWERRLQERGS
jgi:ABC-type nitrate/sulfonate/bicarbonate transport system permease component